MEPIERKQRVEHRTMPPYNAAEGDAGHTDMKIGHMFLLAGALRASELDAPGRSQDAHVDPRTGKQHTDGSQGKN